LLGRDAELLGRWRGNHEEREGHEELRKTLSMLATGRTKGGGTGEVEGTAEARRPRRDAEAGEGRGVAGEMEGGTTKGEESHPSLTSMAPA
jgi:hypothetical protein